MLPLVHAVLRHERTDVQQQRLLADGGMSVRLCLRELHRELHTNIHEMLGARCRDVRFVRHLASDADVPDGVQLGFVWLVRLRGHAVQRPLCRVVQRLGSVARNGYLSVRL
jgi:hypothetical protein